MSQCVWDRTPLSQTLIRLLVSTIIAIGLFYNHLWIIKKCLITVKSHLFHMLQPALELMESRCACVETLDCIDSVGGLAEPDSGLGGQTAATSKTSAYKHKYRLSSALHKSAFLTISACKVWWLFIAGQIHRSCFVRVCARVRVWLGGRMREGGVQAKWNE